MSYANRFFLEAKGKTLFYQNGIGHIVGSNHRCDGRRQMDSRILGYASLLSLFLRVDVCSFSA